MDQRMEPGALTTCPVNHPTVSLDALLVSDYTPPSDDDQSQLHILTLEPVEEEACNDVPTDEGASFLSLPVSEDPFSSLQSPDAVSAEEPVGQDARSTVLFSPAPSLSCSTVSTRRRLESVASANVDHSDFKSAARALASDVRRRKSVKKVKPIDGRVDELQPPNGHVERQTLPSHGVSPLADPMGLIDSPNPPVSGIRLLKRRRLEPPGDEGVVTQHRNSFQCPVREEEEGQDCRLPTRQDERLTTPVANRDICSSFPTEERGSVALQQDVSENPETLLPLRDERVISRPLRKNQKRRKKASLTSERPVRAQATKRSKVEDHRDPSELTLWELVLRNKRILTEEELKARKAAAVAKAAREAEDAKMVSGAVVNDEFADLFSDARTGESTSTPRRDEAASDLFDFDPCMSNTGGGLHIDADGNLLLEDGYRDPRNAERTSMVDGQQTVTENYLDMQLVKPFAGAYKVTKATKWSEEDEDKFFKAISTFGLDLMMVKSLLPNYTDRQILDKYRLEERKGNGRVDNALKQKIVITTDTFERLHGPIDDSSHYMEFGDTDSEDEGEGRHARRQMDGMSVRPPIESGVGSLFEDEVVEDDDDEHHLFGSRLGRESLSSTVSSSNHPDSLATLLGL